MKTINNEFVKMCKDDITLPISSLGNLCYLPANLNKRKQYETIYQYCRNHSLDGEKLKNATDHINFENNIMTKEEILKRIE